MVPLDVTYFVKYSGNNSYTLLQVEDHKNSHDNLCRIINTTTSIVYSFLLVFDFPASTLFNKV